MTDIDWKEIDADTIKKLAYLRDDDDIYSHVDNLIKEWSVLSPSEIKIDKPSDLYTAAAMLADGILPENAKHELGLKFLDLLNELARKKIRAESINLFPPARGRKADRNMEYRVLRTVIKLKEQGKSATHAYQEVATELHKDVSTIRRIYERATKLRRERGFP